MAEKMSATTIVRFLRTEIEQSRRFENRYNATHQQRQVPVHSQTTKVLEWVLEQIKNGGQDLDYKP